MGLSYGSKLLRKSSNAKPNRTRNCPVGELGHFAIGVSFARGQALIALSIFTIRTSSLDVRRQAPSRGPNCKHLSVTTLFLGKRFYSGGNDFNFCAHRDPGRRRPYSTVTLLARFRG